MTRSIWKKPFSKKSLFKSIYFNKLSKKQESIFIKSRDCFIFPSFVGSTFCVYDGKKFAHVHIFENMIGHKFGEFVATRKKVVHKKKQNNRKK